MTWTYDVANTGNAPLAGVTVTDDQGVAPIFDPASDDGNGLLDPGETWVYEATGTATPGQFDVKYARTFTFVWSTVSSGQFFCNINT